MKITTPKVGDRIMVETLDGLRLHGKVVAIRNAKGEGYLVDWQTKGGTIRTINPILTNLAHMFY